MRLPIELNARVKEKIFSFAVFFVIALLGAVIYRNTFDVPLVFDDMFNIIENSTIRNVANLKSIWRYDPSRFVTHVSFALNFHFSQLEVYSYHAVNFVLHLLTAGSCYLFLTLLLDNPSAMSPAVFRRRRWIAA